MIIEKLETNERLIHFLQRLDFQFHAVSFLLITGEDLGIEIPQSLQYARTEIVFL